MKMQLYMVHIGLDSKTLININQPVLHPTQIYLKDIIAAVVPSNKLFMLVHS